MSDIINILTDLDTVEVSLVDKGANKKEFAIFKSEEQMEEENSVDKALDDNEKGKLRSIVDSLMSMLGSGEEGEEMKEEDGVEKEDVEKAQAEVVRLQKEVNDLQSENRLAKAVAKCESDFANVPAIASNALAAVMIEIEDKAPECLKSLEEVFVAINEMAKSSEVMKEQGSNSQAERVSASERMEKIAKQIAEESGCDFYTAYAKALSENKDLYNEIQKEKEL